MGRTLKIFKNWFYHRFIDVFRPPISSPGLQQEVFLLDLPNELLLEVASHLPHLKDVNSLLRCNCRLHSLLDQDLHRRAVHAPGTIATTRKTKPRAAAGLFTDQRGQLPTSIPRKHRYPLRTMLHYAAASNQPSLLRKLISYGALEHINIPDFYGTTPLHSASLLGYTEIVEILLENGGNHQLHDRFGWTPLQCAILGLGISGSSRGSLVARKLVAAGADKEVSHFIGGYTALHLAVVVGDPVMVSLLIDLGSDVWKTDHNGRSLIWTSASCHFKEITTILSLAGVFDCAEINRSDRWMASTRKLVFSNIERLLYFEGIRVDLRGRESAGRIRPSVARIYRFLYTYIECLYNNR